MIEIPAWLNPHHKDLGVGVGDEVKLSPEGWTLPECQESEPPKLRDP